MSELDFTPELQAKGAAYYHFLIGMLRWIVELGRVGICREVSMMSFSLALPCSSHLEQLYYIFLYLKKHHKTNMIFDPTELQ